MSVGGSVVRSRSFISAKSRNERPDGCNSRQRPVAAKSSARPSPVRPPPTALSHPGVPTPTGGPSRGYLQMELADMPGSPNPPPPPQFASPYAAPHGEGPRRVRPGRVTGGGGEGGHGPYVPRTAAGAPHLRTSVPRGEGERLTPHPCSIPMFEDAQVPGHGRDKSCGSGTAPGCRVLAARGPGLLFALP